ncbi:MAG: response regulator transcription factor [Oscillospiraceae bacterium]|nr:response regulator transcription factor [Oscillospiraceae bacterium]
MINTILVEDDRFIQEYFSNMLAADNEFYLIAAVRDAFEAEKLCGGNIDLVLMDVQTLHRHSGLAAGKRIREAWPHIKVVITTSLVDPEVLARAKAGCADSLWYKDHGSDELLHVIRRTLQGERVFPDEAPPVELEQILSGDIAPVQLEILRCYIRGMTYSEIGEKFGITSDGARWHIRELVKKCGFNNKEELIAAVISSKLIITTLKEE